MVKILIFLVSICSFSQSVIKHNVNVDAKELECFLIGDTIKLKGQNKIDNVTFRCGEFRKHYQINQKIGSIVVKDFPDGHFVVHVITNRKIIVFNFYKNQKPKK